MFYFIPSPNYRKRIKSESTLIWDRGVYVWETMVTEPAVKEANEIQGAATVTAVAMSPNVPTHSPSPYPSP